jgi:hypothetical protein
MLPEMKDEEILRLRKIIRRTYASQPHKIKCWLGLLEMYGKNSMDPAGAMRGPDCVVVPRVGAEDASSSAVLPGNEGERFSSIR